VIVVAAAGNKAVSAANNYPGSCAGVISVGASNKDNNIASFSNYGQGVSVFAPGRSVYTLAGGYGAVPVSGTSYSAPIITGIISLMEAYRPSLTIEDAKRALHVTGKPLVSCASGRCLVNRVDATNILNYWESPIKLASNYVKTSGSYDWRCKSSRATWSYSTKKITHYELFGSRSLNILGTVDNYPVIYMNPYYQQGRLKLLYRGNDLSDKIRFASDGYVGVRACNNTDCSPIMNSTKRIEGLRSHCENRTRI
jgi:hypothetical protein